MKTILRDGMLVTFFQRCSACGCVFRYHKTDLSEGMFPNRLALVNCPCCGQPLVHNDEYNAKLSNVDG